jgi:SAM-dependent methyltransferase
LHETRDLKPYLQKLHREYTDKYCALFIKAKPVAVRELPAGWEALVDSHLCSRQDALLIPLVLVSKVFDLFVATDLPHYKGSDRVLYLADQDSFLLARHMPNLTGKHHLDIGSGSGVLGLSAATAHGARQVTAIDISPRAIQFSRFNAALNGVKNIEFVNTSLQDFSPQHPFDFITSNLPFVPVPDDVQFMLSGAGGKDGLALVHVFLEKWSQLTHLHTAVTMISQSPGGRHMSELEAIFLERYAGRAFKIEAIDIFNVIAPIEIQFKPFVGHPNLEAWKTWTREKGYTHQHYLLLNVIPSSHFSYKRKPLTPRLEMVSLNLGSDNWEAHYEEIELARRQSDDQKAAA